MASHIQLEGKTYATSWHPGEAVRAPSLTRRPLAAPLPAEFGIGLSVRMLHDSAAKDRTFWRAGGYRCFYDAVSGEFKMTNGIATAEIPASWDAGDIVGVYGGRRGDKLFVQAKVAGVLTAPGEAAGAAMGGVDEIVIGSGGFGKNKFSPENLRESYWVNPDGDLVQDYASDSYDFTGVLPGRSYVITGNIYYMKVAFYDIDKQYMSMVSGYPLPGRFDFYVPLGAHYIRASSEELCQPEEWELRQFADDHVNGVVADFVLHDRAVEINIAGYLRKVTGGGK